MGRYAAVYLVYSPWGSDGWQDQIDQAIARLEDIGFTGVGDSPGLSCDLGAEQALGLEDAGIFAVYFATPDAASAFADAWERYFNEDVIGVVEEVQLGCRDGE